MSIRKLTDEQFADGTTIDGDRLDLTIQDLEEFINSIPGGDIKTRWVPQTVHVGYLPLTAAADTDVAGANILPLRVLGFRCAIKAVRVIIPLIFIIAFGLRVLGFLICRPSQS